jgi:hypothetical protein
MYFIAYFLLQAWEVSRSRFPLRKGKVCSISLSPPVWSIPWIMFTMFMLFTMQLTTVAFMAHHQNASPCWLRLPIPAVSDLQANNGNPAQSMPGFILVVIAMMQTCLLLLLHLAQCNAADRRLTILSYVICAAMIIEAIIAPAMTSSDAYYYLAYAKLGFASYSAQPQLLPVHAPPFTDWCIHSLAPSAYGPAFIAYLQLVLAVPHAPIAQLLTLRALNALWFLALLALLRCAGASSDILLISALNPVLLFQYIANPHNDIIAVVLTVFGMVTIAFSPIISALAVIGAASVKLSFALIGALVFTRLSSAWKRLGAAACTFFLAIFCSYLFAGPTYFASFAYYAHSLSSHTNFLQYIVAVIAVAASFLALLSNRYGFTGLYALPTLRVQTLFPWYALWSLPYALCEKRLLPPFFILMPIVSVLMETTIPQSSKLILYFFVSVAISISIFFNVHAVKTEEAG